MRLPEYWCFANMLVLEYQQMVPSASLLRGFRAAAWNLVPGSGTLAVSLFSVAFVLDCEIKIGYCRLVR
jgi:hypothetical protein